MRILGTFSEIAVSRGYRVFVMALTICTEKMTVMVSEFPKDSRKSLFAGDVRQDITNNLRHRKCVRFEMSINTYLEE